MKRLVLPLILALALSLTSCGVMIEILDSMLEHEHAYAYTLQPGGESGSFDLVKSCTFDYCDQEQPIIEKNVEVYISSTTVGSCTDGAKVVYSHDVNGMTVSFTVEGEKGTHTLAGIPVDKLFDEHNMIDSGIPGVVLPEGVNLQCQGTYSGSYVCDSCDSSVEALVYISHSGSRTLLTAPTCTAEGREAIDCNRCNMRIELEIEPLGHDHAFTAIENQDGSFDISRICNAQGCTSSPTVVSGVTDLVMISGGVATCQSASKTVYSYQKSGQTKTIEVDSRSLPHHLNGNDISSITNPDGSVDYGASGIVVASGLTVTCGKTVSGFYLCDTCAKLVNVDVYVRPHHIEPSEMWTVTASTCQAAGKTVKECLYCDYTEQQVVPEADLGKYHQVSWSVTLAGADISTAISSGRCTTVGCTFSVNAAPMDKGSYSFTTNLADCYSVGEINHTWTVGGATVSYTTHNLAVGHLLHDANGNLAPTWMLADENGCFDVALDDVGIFASSSITCGSTSEGYYCCALCGDVMKVAVVKNHVMTAYTYRAPTCTVDGLRTFKCSDCGSLDSEIIKASHVFEYVHDIESGTLSYKCTRNTDCNHTPEIIDLSTGNLAVKSVITPSTCTEYGVAEYVFFRGSTTINFTGVLARSSHKVVDNSGNIVDAKTLADANGYFDTSLECIKYFANDSKPAVGYTGYGYYICAHCGEPVRVTVINTGKK